jgi:undecaprenyl-diphosphatase
MTAWQAIWLALVQGATEFLPISSSAHLVLMPRLFGWQDQGLAFDVAANTGTLVAVMLYFRAEVGRLTIGLLRWLRRPSLEALRGPTSKADPGKDPGAGQEEAGEARLAVQLLVATVPAALFGLLAQGWIASAARDPLLIAGTSIGFGVLLWAADRYGARRRELGVLGWRDALLIGAAQALALIPGTSRSGVTMTAALLLGFDRTTAARFSFLLAIPIGLLAAGKTALDAALAGLPAGAAAPMVLAFVVAALAALLVIAWLLAWLRRQTMTVFAVYRVALGLVILGLWLAAG